MEAPNTIFIFQNQSQQTLREEHGGGRLASQKAQSCRNHGYQKPNYNLCKNSTFHQLCTKKMYTGVFARHGIIEVKQSHLDNLTQSFLKAFSASSFSLLSCAADAQQQFRGTDS